MNKGVLVGGGLGLLALAFLAGVWLTSPPAGSPEPAPVAPGASSPTVASAPAALGQSSPVPAGTPPEVGASGHAPAPASSAPSAQDPPWSAAPAAADGEGDGGERMSKEERRKVRAAVRIKMAELLAKGNSATLEDTQKLMDEVEALGQGQFDTRYFATMRKMIEHSARLQVLSKELGQISSQTTPQAEARRTAILAEIRDLGDRMNNGAQAMQSYTRDALVGKQP